MEKNFQIKVIKLKNKKVFLIGHKGARMLKTLSILVAKVKGYSLESKTNDDLYNLINGEEI